jgi:hypothetical protein
MKKGASKKKRPVAKKAKTVKKKTKTPVQKKKATPAGAKAALKKTISNSLKMIAKIRSKGKASQDAIEKEQKKMFRTNDPTDKLLCYFQIEGLKIDSFAKIESEYKTLSLLLNQSYKHAHKIGGIVWDDFLNICADLSKGIDLDFMEKTMKKMLNDLKIA